MCGYFIHCHVVIFLHHGFNRCNAIWCHHSVAWLGRSQSVTELMPFMNFSVHSYTCCSDRHASPYWTFHLSMNFDGFHPFNTPFFFGACCKRGGRLYSTTALSRCIPALHCHLSATLQIMSNTDANLRENRAVFWIFIALLRFSFESPSYLNGMYGIKIKQISKYTNNYCVL
jgi:hypothetical protein